jgi:hypothetical protein
VPPWPYGPVAVRTTKAGIGLQGRTTNDRLCFLLPIRDGDETRFMEWEEAMRMLQPDVRRPFLKLREFLSGRQRRKVHITSAVRFDVGGGVRGPVVANVDARATSVSTESLTLEMACTPVAIEAAAFMVAAARNARMREVVDGFGSGVSLSPQPSAKALERATRELSQRFGRTVPGDTVSVPLTFVREVWEPAQRDGHLHLSLYPELVWLGPHWTLRGP